MSLAYKAAQPADPEKADGFLINLRRAMVIHCRPNTHLDVILDVIRFTGIDEVLFNLHYSDGVFDMIFSFEHLMDIGDLLAPTPHG